MEQLTEDIRQLLEREDLTAEEIHVALVSLLMRENRRCQALLQEAQQKIADERRQREEIEASRQALLAVSKALWREAGAHPDRTGHPIAHSASLRQQIYDRAYRQQLAQVQCRQLAQSGPPGVA